MVLVLWVFLEAPGDLDSTVDSILDAISGDNDAVIGFSVADVKNAQVSFIY
jgi:hypothetical protein